MKSVLFIVALLPSLAWGQPLCFSNGNGNCLTLLRDGGERPFHGTTGEADIDHAVSICDAHLRLVPYMEGPIWETDISGCDQVYSAWSNSKAEKDRRAAEAKKKDEEDRALIAQFVKGLKHAP